MVRAREGVCADVAEVMIKALCCCQLPRHEFKSTISSKGLNITVFQEIEISTGKHMIGDNFCGLTFFLGISDLTKIRPNLILTVGTFTKGQFEIARSWIWKY